mgnify:CR=1 FL=1
MKILIQNIGSNNKNVTIPTFVNEKIKESADPVVGLKYIHEFIADSDPEMEPYYECELCGSQGHSNMIFGHIMGSRHRQNFAVKIYGKNKCMNMHQAQLLDLARKYNENNDKINNNNKFKFISFGT